MTGETRFMKIRLHPTLKLIFVVLGWATTCAALTLFTIFNGQLLPRNINGGGLYSDVLSASPLGLWIFYVGNFAISVLAAMVISELGKSLISFLPSYLGAAMITFLVLAAPDFAGIYDPQQVIQESAVIFTFTAFFPLLLLVSFSGTIVGNAIGERFL
jgi:hypothetical protein